MNQSAFTQDAKFSMADTEYCRVLLSYVSYRHNLQVSIKYQYANCFVKNCKSRTNYVFNKNVKYFSFPKDQELRLK